MRLSSKLALIGILAIIAQSTIAAPTQGQPPSSPPPEYSVHPNSQYQYPRHKSAYLGHTSKSEPPSEPARVALDVRPKSAQQRPINIDSSSVYATTPPVSSSIDASKAPALTPSPAGTPQSHEQQPQGPSEDFQFRRRSMNEDGH